MPDDIGVPPSVVVSRETVDDVQALMQFSRYAGGLNLERSNPWT
jgi:hypothetical protein